MPQKHPIKKPNIHLLPIPLDHPQLSATKPPTKPALKIPPAKATSGPARLKRQIPGPSNPKKLISLPKAPLAIKAI